MYGTTEPTESTTVSHHDLHVIQLALLAAEHDIDLGGAVATDSSGRPVDVMGTLAELTEYARTVRLTMPDHEAPATLQLTHGDREVLVLVLTDTVDACVDRPAALDLAGRLGR